MLVTEEPRSRKRHTSSQPAVACSSPSCVTCFGFEIMCLCIPAHYGGPKHPTGDAFTPGLRPPRPEKLSDSTKNSVGEGCAVRFPRAGTRTICQLSDGNLFCVSRIVIYKMLFTHCSGHHSAVSITSTKDGWKCCHVSLRSCS